MVPNDVRRSFRKIASWVPLLSVLIGIIMGLSTSGEPPWPFWFGLMMIHELGHTITAWLLGVPAVCFFFCLFLLRSFLVFSSTGPRRRVLGHLLGHK